MLSKTRKGVDLKYCNDSKVFIEYLNGTADLFENIEECILVRKCRILLVFDDMIIKDPISNKKPNPVVKESSIRDRKLNILLLLHNRIFMY